MSKPNQKPAGGQDSETFDALVKAAFVVFAGAWLLTVKYVKNNPEKLRRLNLKQLCMISGGLILLGFGCLACAKIFFIPRQAWYWLFSLLGVWLGSGGLTLGTHWLWNSNPEKDRITTKLLGRKATNYEQLIETLFNPSTIPIGLSLRNNLPYFVPIEAGLEHVVITGATGVGKTTTLITMVIHSLVHKRPVIIVDPKGDSKDLDLIRDLVRAFNRESDLLIFSLANPAKSCSYNPLKFGDQENKRSKLIEGLELNHEYYGSVASNYLGILFDILDFLNEKTPTLSRIDSILTNENVRRAIEEDLLACEETEEVTSLIGKFQILKSVPMKDLAGLVAQIGSFGLRNFLGVLNPSKSQNPEIDLVDVLQNSKIAYFQLNTNMYGEISKGLGKILISDIKQISNLFQSGKLERKYEYAGIFIDEFGSFAIKDFADFQKQVRTAHIGLRLFFQGMADLRTVSPEFEDQILGNCLIKIIMRQDIDPDVQKWSGMAGTVDAVIQSYQTQNDIFGSSMTGMGNVHEGKKVKIDFDVFKELGRGQAVIIDKGRQFHDLIQIWDAKSPFYLPQLTKQIKARALAKAAKITSPEEKPQITDSTRSKNQTQIGSNAASPMQRPLIFRSNGSGSLVTHAAQGQQNLISKNTFMKGPKT